MVPATWPFIATKTALTRNSHKKPPATKMKNIPMDILKLWWSGLTVLQTEKNEQYSPNSGVIRHRPTKIAKVAQFLLSLRFSYNLVTIQ